MRVKVDRKDLADRAAHAARAAARDAESPLSLTLLRAEEGALHVTAGDSEVGFSARLEAEVDGEGAAAVSAADLGKIIRSQPAPRVRLVLGGAAGSRLEVSSGLSTFTLPAAPAGDYPAPPPIDERASARLSASALLRLVDRTRRSVAVDSARYGLNGAHLEDLGDGVLRAAATDGHRLSVADEAFEGEARPPERTLAPPKALAQLSRILPDLGDEPVDVLFGERAMRVDSAGRRLWFRMLDGEFPDYRAVTPDEPKIRAEFDVDDLAGAARRAKVLAAGGVQAMRLALTEGEARVRLRSVDRGEFEEGIDAEFSGDDVEVAFNPRLLEDVFSALQGQRVVLQFEHPLGPCVFRDPDDDSQEHVVMPIRTD